MRDGVEPMEGKYPWRRSDHFRCLVPAFQEEIAINQELE
jgi:hypothetical protein